MKHVSTKYLSVLAVVSLLSLSACSGAGGGLSKGTIGAGAGAAVGALAGQAIGHNTKGTLIGTALGTALGYIIGNEMDKYDQQQLNHMYERGVSGQTSSWVNPDTGYQYEVTPHAAYRGEDGRWCRNADIDSWIDGEKKTVASTACRTSNGQWELQH